MIAMRIVLALRGQGKHLNTSAAWGWSRIRLNGVLRKNSKVPLPKFIGIGAPRSGTRWLAQCLAEHPEVSIPPEEVYFFTTRRVVHSYWERGVEWYEQLFAQTMKTGAVTWGEVTPTYLLDEGTAERIYQVVPDVKLICILRDQSERAYSWYRFFLNVNRDLYNSDYSFRRFLTYHTEVYAQEGLYLDL